MNSTPSSLTSNAQVTTLRVIIRSTLGKTNTLEYGLRLVTEPELFGPTHNPWDLTRTPGDSSGGSAAAVAACLVPLAHGNDGGGSIRIPASCCGLFGLKPTRGRNPMGPDVGEGWHGLSCDHVLSRSVRDSAAMLDATSGPNVGAPYLAQPLPFRFLDQVDADSGGLRIAFSAQPLAPSGPEGLPLGMQFVGHYGDEATLFRLAGQLEKAHPWFNRLPPTCAGAVWASPNGRGAWESVADGPRGSVSCQSGPGRTRVSPQEREEHRWRPPVRST
jgi:Asp-tRNA(Asn)/Glu-tRNA(Gln) amidotransferase A subunit family amidase